METRTEAPMQPFDSPVVGQSENSRRVELLSVRVVAVVALLMAVGIAAGFALHLVRDKPDPAFVLALGWIPIMYVVALLITGVGLWNRRPWAYGTAIQVFGVLAVVSLLNNDIIELLVFLVLMAFLVIPRVRR